MLDRRDFLRCAGASALAIAAAGVTSSARPHPHEVRIFPKDDGPPERIRGHWLGLHDFDRNLLLASELGPHELVLDTRTDEICVAFPDVVFDQVVGRPWIEHVSYNIAGKRLWVSDLVTVHGLPIKPDGGSVTVVGIRLGMNFAADHGLR